MPLFKSVVTIQSAVLGGTGTNSWHARTGSDLETPIGIAEELEDITGWLNTFYATLNPVIVGGTTFATDGVWTSVDEEEAVQFDAPGWTTSMTGDDWPAPPATCIVVGWRTSSPTRGGRGRTFLGPIMLNTIDEDGTPKSDAMATVRGAADALVESSDSFANGALGVYSRAGVVEEAPGVFRDFTSAVVHDKYAVLRSRRD